MLGPEKKALMREYYLNALNQDTGQLAALSSTAISTMYPKTPEWCVGPFRREDKLTFKKPAQWRDPLDIGWTGNFVFNCSLMKKDGKLYMLYRCAPKKETLCSRIGVAVYEEGAGWKDYEENPVIYPTEEDELLGCEDPKIYKVADKYVLFYHGVYYPDAEQKRRFESPDFPISIGTNIKWAVSDDLLHWEKKGLAVPLEVSRLWAKAAVVPRDPDGCPIKIGGEYLMFLSEGCGGRQTIGRSADMMGWAFSEQSFLDIGSLGHLYEVSCCIYDERHPERFVLDFYHQKPDGGNGGAQALYRTAEPFRQLEINVGAALSWGGLIEYGGRWLFAQGWDSPPTVPEMFFYSADRKEG